MDFILTNILKKENTKTVFASVLFLSLATGLGYHLGHIFGISTIKTGKHITNYKMHNKKIRRLVYSFYKRKTFFMDDQIDSIMVSDFKKFVNGLKNDEEFDIVIETNGGSFSCGQMISNIISSYKGTVNALVYNHAFSAGTLIALSCTNLYMHPNANLSPVDVIHCSFYDEVQLSSIKHVLDNKSGDRIDDKTFMLADQATKCMKILDKIFVKIIKSRYDEQTSNLIKEEIFSGENYVHNTAFPVEHLKDIGIKIDLMNDEQIRKCKLVY
jgi:hypothetical protein